jgi:hypothetical protein
MRPAQYLATLYHEALAADPALETADWYHTEREGILRDCPAAPPTRILRAAAALSPRVHWSRVRYALPYFLQLEDVSAGIALGFLGRSVRGALLELSGDTGGLGRGLKTNAFAANLTGDYDSITVDVWAARAARVDSPYVGTRRGYETVAGWYRDAAASLGVPPALVQARIWVHVRATWDP